MSEKKQATRDGFGRGMLAAANENEKVVALCADLTESLRLTEFSKRFPERFVQVGVAEQNLIGLASGLALAGKVPFAASYAVFSPGNSWGIIRSSICYSNLNVKVVGGHAGLVTGPDGATHQALEDIAIMRALPNMTVVVPADAHQTEQATIALADQVGPAYLRIGKYEVENITSNEDFKIGKAQILQSGNDATIIACGEMVHVALEAAKRLSEKEKSLTVINLHTIKPIDEQAIVQAASLTPLLVTLEDHQVAGGMGSAVLEVLSKHQETIRTKLIGVEDEFGESGKPEELLEKHGLTADHVANTILQLL